MGDGYRYLQPYRWQVKDGIAGDEGFEIHSWCLTRDGGRALLRVVDFMDYIYVELPTFVGRNYFVWTPDEVETAFGHIRIILGKNAPDKSIFVEREKLYYYQAGRKYPFMKFYFRSQRAMRNCVESLKNGVVIPGIGLVHLQIREAEIDTELKFMANKDMGPCQWLKVRDKPALPQQHISTFRMEDEYIAGYDSVQPLPEELTSSWETSPRRLAVDIEVKSSNINMMPQKWLAGNDAFAVSMILDEKGKRTRHIIVYGDSNQFRFGDDPVVIHKANSELELLKKYEQLMLELDPDIVIGFNILNFDMPYLDARLHRKMQNWGQLGRLIGIPAPHVVRQKGFSFFEFYPLEMDGRLYIDLLPIVFRDHKLLKYTLNAVAKKFTGKEKRDINHKDIFRSFDAYMIAYQKLLGASKQTKIDQQHADMVIDEYKKAVEKLTQILDYCIQDSELTLDIMDKLNMFMTQSILSDIFCIQIYKLYTSGQTKRCFALLYYEAIRQKIVVDRKPPTFSSFPGGFVKEVADEIQIGVAVVDFSGMYPNIIMSNNICYRSFVPPDRDKEVPDEKCNVFLCDNYEENEVKDGRVAEKTKGDDESDDEEDDETEKPMRQYKTKFVKDCPTIVPAVMKRLVTKRAAAKELLKDKTLAPFVRLVIACREYGLKISANAFFGYLGFAKGDLPCVECGMAICFVGRGLIQMVIARLEELGYPVKGGDTDSAMFKVNSEDRSQWNAIGRRAARIINGQEEGYKPLFPGTTLKVEFEKAGIYLPLSKKRYIIMIVDDAGNLQTHPDKLIIKGALNARRDICPWAQEVFLDLVIRAMQGAPFLEVITLLTKELENTLKGGVSWEKLSVVKGYKGNYKGNSSMKVLGDRLRNSGITVTPGERLTYVVKDMPRVKRLGDRMVLVDEYLAELATGQPVLLDYLYYVEKQLAKSVNTVLTRVYKKEMTKLDSFGLKLPQKQKLRTMYDFVNTVGLTLKTVPTATADSILEYVKAVIEDRVKPIRQPPPIQVVQPILVIPPKQRTPRIIE